MLRRFLSSVFLLNAVCIANGNESSINSSYIDNFNTLTINSAHLETFDNNVSVEKTRADRKAKLAIIKKDRLEKKKARLASLAKTRADRKAKLAIIKKERIEKRKARLASLAKTRADRKAKLAIIKKERLEKRKARLASLAKTRADRKAKLAIIKKDRLEKRKARLASLAKTRAEKKAKLAIIKKERLEKRKARLASLAKTRADRKAKLATIKKELPRGKVKTINKSHEQKQIQEKSQEQHVALQENTTSQNETGEKALNSGPINPLPVVQPATHLTASVPTVQPTASLTTPVEPNEPSDVPDDPEDLLKKVISETKANALCRIDDFGKAAYYNDLSTMLLKVDINLFFDNKPTTPPDVSYVGDAYPNEPGIVLINEKHNAITILGQGENVGEYLTLSYPSKTSLNEFVFEHDCSLRSNMSVDEFITEIQSGFQKEGHSTPIAVKAASSN